MPRRRMVAPFLRQLAGDPLGLGRSAQSERSERLAPRTRTADRVVQSICPYCAVGCAQKVYVKDEKVKYVVSPQRARIRRGERTGAARRESKLHVIEPEFGSPASAPVEHDALGGQPTAAR